MVCNLGWLWLHRSILVKWIYTEFIPCHYNFNGTEKVIYRKHKFPFMLRTCRWPWERSFFPRFRFSSLGNGKLLFVKFKSLATSNCSIVLFPALNIPGRLTRDNQRIASCKESKTVLDYGFHILDPGSVQVLDCGFFVDGLCGFQISIVRGIPNSLSCFPHSKGQDSCFY